MTEQIYINGILMDQEGGKPTSLVYQSPIFTDIDNIVSNRTNSVSFPVTRNNLNAIDNCQMTSGSSKFAYRRHTVKYYRDGVQIFSGYGTLMSVTQTQIKFTFTWGNVAAFKKLLDYKLRKIKGPAGQAEISIPWRDDAVNTPNFAMNLDTGGYPHPVMKVSTLLAGIELTTGVTIENKELLSDYRIPVTGKQADDNAKRNQGAMTGNDIYAKTWGMMCHFLTSAPANDVRGMYIGNGMYDVEPYETLQIIVPASFRYSCTKHTGVSSQQVAVFAVDEDGNHPKQLAYVQMYKNESGARFIYTTGSDIFGKETILNLNVSEYTHLMIKVREFGSAIESTTTMEGNLTLIPDYDKEQELIYGGVYPMIRNLPDWTLSQLLKNLMKMEGLFATCPDESTIRLVSIDDLYAQRENAVDITDALMLGSSDSLTKEYSFGSYSQKNIFKYAEDGTVKTDASGYITIDDDNLGAESELLSLDFAASDDNGKTVSLPLYTTNEDGGYDYADVTPRILKVKSVEGNREKLTFRGLEWPRLIADRYSGFSDVIRNAKVIKASMRISTVQLANLDLMTPVFSYSLGHYYAILSLTTKENGIADVELLQLQDRNDEDTGEPQLTVIKNSDGNYVATLANKTTAQINTIRNSKDYRVCLIRHGYARRGKYFKYTNKYGEKTNSKTSRTAGFDKVLQCAGYKQVRKEEGGGTPCWRIIGYEQLKTGRLSENSQVNGFYGGATLVFKLLDPISLPPMRRKKKAVTKSGRLTNRAKDGLSELSIALFRRNESGKWEMISNVCPIRSRTASKTGYWEYNPSNELSL